MVFMRKTQVTGEEVLIADVSGTAFEQSRKQHNRQATRQGGYTLGHGSFLYEHNGFKGKHLLISLIDQAIEIADDAGSRISF